MLRDLIALRAHVRKIFVARRLTLVVELGAVAGVGVPGAAPASAVDVDLVALTRSAELAAGRIIVIVGIADQRVGFIQRPATNRSWRACG